MAYDDFMQGGGGYPNGSYMNNGAGMNGYGGNNGGYGFGNQQSQYGYGMGGIPDQGQNQQPQQNGNHFQSLLTGIPAIMQGFGMMGNQGGNNTLNTLGKNSANISDALTNANNPLYTQLYGQEKQQNLQNLAAATSQMQGENRMQSAMGRTPLFAQGRGGEMAFRNLMGGYQNADLNAQNQTRASLMQALQGTNQGAYLGAQQHNANAMQNNGMLNSFSSIGQLLKSFS